MKLLNLKYKMHKLVNLVFYLIIFGIGFLLGFGVEKINFNKLISQFLFIDNVSAVSEFRLIQDKDIVFHGGIGNPYIMNGSIYITSAKTFSILKLHTDITEIRGKSPVSMFFTYKDNGDGTYNVIDSSGKKFTLTPSSTNVVSLGQQDYIRPPVNSDLTITLKDGVITIKDDSTTYATISDSNMIGFWSSAEPDVLDNVFLKNIYVNNYDYVDDNTGGDNTGDDNIGEDNTDEDIEVEIVNSGFYEFAQKIFGEVSEENKFIYDFITFGLVATCFILFVLVVGYIFNKIFGG